MSAQAGSFDNHLSLSDLTAGCSLRRT